MDMRIAFVALALALGGCQRQSDAPDGAERSGQLGAPAASSEPSRLFAPVNDAARGATGAVTMSVALRLPDQAGADSQDVVTIRAAKGLVVEAQLVSQVEPSTQVQGQTLRALLALPVEEPQTLVYRVSTETHPEGVSGLCGAAPAAFVIVWEPTTPGESGLKVLGFTGGAPGAADSRACAMLEYARE